MVPRGTTPGRAGAKWYPLVLALAVALDAFTTTLGLGLGLAERGPLASRLLPVLGPAYWLLAYAVLHGLARLLEARGVPGSWAQLAASTGPWLAGWANLGAIARSAGVPAW